MVDGDFPKDVKTWLLWTRKEKRKKKILFIFNQCINSIHRKKPG